jgi:hypothetical protein
VKTAVLPAEAFAANPHVQLHYFTGAANTAATQTAAIPATSEGGASEPPAGSTSESGEAAAGAEGATR